MLGIPGSSSTAYSGFCEQERSGGICHENTETGKMYTAGFFQWRDRELWEKILEALADDTDFEWLIIDASHVRVHPEIAGA